MAYKFLKILGKPSFAHSGVYLVDDKSTINTNELNGLSIESQLQRFSLGNWNSIVKNNKAIVSPHVGIGNLIEQGRPVQLQFTPTFFVRFAIRWRGHIDEDTGAEVREFVYNRATDITRISFDTARTNWYNTDYPGVWDYFKSATDQLQLDDRYIIRASDGFGYIQEGPHYDPGGNPRVKIKLDSNLGAKRLAMIDDYYEVEMPGLQDFGPDEYDKGFINVRHRLYFETSPSQFFPFRYSEYGNVHMYAPDDGSTELFKIPISGSNVTIINPSNLHGPVRSPITWANPSWNVKYGDPAELRDKIAAESYVYVDPLEEGIRERERWTSPRGVTLGYPDFSATISVPSTKMEDSVSEFDRVDFKVTCFKWPDDHPLNDIDRELLQGSDFTDNALFYYDEEDSNFIETSYPLKVYLGVDIYDDDETRIHNNHPDEMSLTDQGSIFDLLYNSDSAMSLSEQTIDILVSNNVFYYEVIQWGDEDVLLSNDDISNSEYFNLYTDVGEIAAYDPNLNDFGVKRSFQSQFANSKPIVDHSDPDLLSGKQPLFSHVYSTPGIKSIKIIVYRYTKNLSLLIETILVTKNIVINDGTLLSQDFEIFGGTDFNFLPLKKGSEAIIGGLDGNSKYNRSITKIVKDSLYDEKDFLERKTNLDFLKNFKNGEFGKSPSQLDLSVTRIFKGASDIYDFLMTENQKDQTVQNEYPNFSDDFYGEDDRVKIDSEVTDIFINNSDSILKENCVMEINPQKIEFMAIPNTVGEKDKGILIGDYEMKKEGNQSLRKQGIMQIPLLEEDLQKQAF